MEEMNYILEKGERWRIIGSSFGGLMASLYALQKPHKVEKLILLAPLLSVSELDVSLYKEIDIPVIVFHGNNDKIIPINKTKKRAEALFKNLKYNIVKDDHMLHSTTKTINWLKIIE